MAQHCCLPLLLLLILSSALFPPGNGEKYCVYNSIDANGNNSCLYSPQCGGNIIEILNLTTVIAKHQEVDVYFCSMEYSIDAENVMRFVSKFNITITGTAVKSWLNCQNVAAGLYFENVNELEIKNLVLNQCSFKINRTEKISLSFLASVYIIESANIRITEVIIQDSSGIGIAMIDNTGCVSITYTQLINNHAPECLNPGGGIYIESSNSSNSLKNAHSQITVQVLIQKM